MSQVQDPLLAKHFRWDAQRLFKYDGEDWVRFIDEPWTADSFFDAQVGNFSLLQISNQMLMLTKPYYYRQKSR